MKLQSYCTGSPDSFSKQYRLDGLYDPNIIATLVYLQRPKWIKDDEVWKKIVDSIKLELPLGFDVK